MELIPEPRPVLAICLNPAWQKTLVFKHLSHGQVNRAVSENECGGGKGVNVVRVFRNLGLPAALAGFAGGHSGKLLRRELEQSGVESVLQETASPTRICTTVISSDNSEVTELIGVSEPVSETESNSLMDSILEKLPKYSAVVFAGTSAPGVPADFCGKLARAAASAGIPFVLDAVKNVDDALAAGITLLKINAEELRQLAGENDVCEAGKKLLSLHPNLKYAAVTDGPGTAYLFGTDGNYAFYLPVLQHVVSAIGCGDCATAVMARRIAEGAAPDKMPGCFAEALACASASCLTDTPSLFATEEAERIARQISINRL